MKPKGKRKESQDRSLNRYLKEIGETPLLIPTVERALAERARGGDETAVEKLTKANLRFVVAIAKRYQGQGLELSDLINEGNIGLIKAAKRFDETRGYKLISYAVWWIRQAILGAINEHARTVRLPGGVFNRSRKLKKLAERMNLRLDQLPTDADVLEALKEAGLDLTHEQLREAQALRNEASLDEPQRQGANTGQLDESHFTLLDQLADETQPSAEDERLKQLSVKQVVAALELVRKNSEEEASVLRLCFGIEEEQSLTDQQVGVQLNIPTYRVRTLKEKALRRLRLILGEQNRKTFV